MGQTHFPQRHLYHHRHYYYYYQFIFPLNLLE